MPFKLYPLLGFMLLIVSCMSPEKLINNPSSEKLYFGKSGGFTNIPLDYAVVDGRHIFRIADNKFIAAGKISASQWKEIGNLINAAGLPQLQLNEPGNMTYYIRMKSDGAEKEIKWTDQTQNPEVWQLFKALNSLVKPTKE